MSSDPANAGDASEQSHLLQKAYRRDFFEQPVKAGWLTAYESWRNPADNGAIYSALVPIAFVENSLRDSSWILGIGEGGPGCTIAWGPSGEEAVAYHRLGGPNGVEPLVLVRDFHGVRPGYVELLEEFRLFHQLYDDKRGGRLLKFNDAGLEDEIVRIEDNRVMVRARELRQFLAIKGMSLVLQIDSISYSTLPLASVPENEREHEHRDDECTWEFRATDDGHFRGEEYRTFSRLLGKRVIAGVAKADSGYWPYSERTAETYPEFIIGADENGEIVRSTCEPDKLDNYFGANPGAAPYLTPVYFRRDVLQRYYSNSSLYSVEDGAIRCGGLWLLPIDNHLDDVVSVYLGDLGRGLPASERTYWLPFNVQADAGISAPKFMRDFRAEFADPTRADLLFKFRLEEFQAAWEKKHGWPFFQRLAPGDEHLLRSLREPLNDDQGEFDSQVLALTKTIVDSLNEKQFASSVKAMPTDAKGITKLELYLTQRGFSGGDPAIGFLRSLQSLRSTGVGHRKGSSYSKAAALFRLEELGRRAAFRIILTQAREVLLEPIGDHFLEAGWR